MARFNGEPLANLTDQEKTKLLETGYGPEDIPTLIRQVAQRLAKRRDWTIDPPGTDTGFPTRNPREPIKVMLVGVGGVGKSRLGSVLAGGSKAIFASSDVVGSETLHVKRADFDFQAQKFAIFDTPGYVISEVMENGLSMAHKAIGKGLDEMGDGIHVIVFVISAGNGRSYDSEIQILTKARILNRRTFKHCMIVVTHCDGKYSEGGRQRLMENLTKNESVATLLRDINERVVLVELGSEKVYKCELDQARKMVFAMVAKIVNDNTINREEGEQIYYERKYMVEDLEKAMVRAGIPLGMKIGVGAGVVGAGAALALTCFPSKAMAYGLEEKKVMKELCLNENVLVVDNCGALQYEPVIMFSHADPDERSEFVSITTDSGRVLRLSSGHLLPVGELGALVSACEVKVGDVVFAVGNDESLGVVPEKVVAIGVEQLHGLYCPHTPSGSIVVDGIVTSCYTGIVPTVVAHGALLPVRVLHRILPTEWFTWLHAHGSTQRLLSNLRSVASVWR